MNRGCRMKKLLPAIVCSCSFIAGMGYLSIPYFDGWSEIVWPRLSNLWSWAFFLWDVKWMWLFVAIQCIFFLVALMRNWSRRKQGVTLALLLILVLMWQVIYPPTVSHTTRRIDAFSIGGWTRMMWAGGPQKIQDAAKSLVDTALSSSPPKTEWPLSIKMLGASYIEIDTSTSTVDVYLPRKNTLADQFGFLIQTADEKPTQILGEHRIWPLADGVYFYEIW